MTFLSSQSLQKILPKVVEPFDQDRIRTAAYELSMGSEVFITGTDMKTKSTLSLGDQREIPPGQFALLITEEKVAIPKKYIGFIAIKFGIKKLGLVNISGFHVDPGFEGKLLFSVYNAGSKSIVVSRGARIFLMWLSELDKADEIPYGKEHKHHGQDTISDGDIMQLHGDVYSPSALMGKIEKLRDSVDKRISEVNIEASINRRLLLGLIIGLSVALFTVLITPIVNMALRLLAKISLFKDLF